MSHTFPWTGVLLASLAAVCLDAPTRCTSITNEHGWMAETGHSCGLGAEPRGFCCECAPDRAHRLRWPSPGRLAWLSLSSVVRHLVPGQLRTGSRDLGLVELGPVEGHHRLAGLLQRLHEFFG